MTALVKELARKQRQKRVRKKVFGTVQKPRLSVFRSNHHIYVQAVDDLEGRTLVSASSLDKEIGKESAAENKTTVAKRVGKIIGARLLKKNINVAVFDRNGYRYHGRLEALAEGAREAGLNF